MAPSAGTHHPVRANNLKSYKPLEHQHVPEITETLTLAGAKDLALRFVPVSSAPLSRGILATRFVKLDAGPGRQERLTPSTGTPYASEPFVRVPEKRLPEVAAVERLQLRRDRPVGSGPAEGAARTVRASRALDNLDQGRRRPGDPVDEHRARPRREITLEDAGGYP